MPPRPLVGLLVATGICLAPSARALDSDSAVKDIRGLQRAPQGPEDWKGAEAVGVFQKANGNGWRTEREAALTFVDFVRQPFFDQRLEHCAYVVRDADSRFRVSPISEGNMDKCSGGPAPANAAAIVHTHPIWGGADDVHSSGQIFSDNDYAAAEWTQRPMPIYLGAPAGHILRYAPGNTYHRGRSIIRRDFEIVRDLNPSVGCALAAVSGIETVMSQDPKTGKLMTVPEYAAANDDPTDAPAPVKAPNFDGRAKCRSL